MRSIRIFAVLCGCVLAFARCSTNGSANLPGVTQTNLGKNVLQLAVGTARVGQDNTVGLNVVATLRQPNGLSAALVNTPSLSGPAGFTVPAGVIGAAGPGNVDAGTGRLSASTQVPIGQPAANTTFGMFDGVFSYGIGPFNSDQSALAFYPGNPAPSFAASAYNGSSLIAAAAHVGDATQPQPFFSGDPFDYLGGPPAYPFFADGVTQPGTFAGYGQGIGVFEVSPVSGMYSLSVAVNPSNAPATTYSASATLSNVAPLPALVAPSVSSATGGGLNGSVAIPADPRITETLVYLVVIHAGTTRFYTDGPIKATGTQGFSIPAELGPCSGAGCQNGSGATPTLTTGDSYFLAAISFDYPAFESSPPNNSSQSPVISGAGGQADVTLSPIGGPFTY